MFKGPLVQQSNSPKEQISKKSKILKSPKANATDDVNLQDVI